MRIHPVAIAALAGAVVAPALSSCASSKSTETDGAEASGVRESSTSETSSTPQSSSPRESESGAANRVEVPESFDVISHRGAAALKPENTLPSFEAALDARADVIELDLHLSKDGRLVVWHDPFVRASKCRRPESPSPGANEEEQAQSRMLPAPAPADANPKSAMVRNLETSQLESYICDRNPDPEGLPDQNAEATELAGSSWGIVTLTEFFEFVRRYASSEKKSKAQRRNARRVEFFLELKRHPDHPSYIDDGFDGSGPATMEKSLAEIVRNFDTVDRTTVQGFTKPSLWAAKKVEPNLRLSVAEAERDAPLSEYADRGASFWSPNAELVDAESVREAHDADLRVVPWTVNDPAKIRELVELGIDGIITDDPTLFGSSD